MMILKVDTESEQVSEERKRKLQKAEGKINQLQESVQRLEEKLTNLELENKVLRQRAISMTPNKILSVHTKSMLQRHYDSGLVFDRIIQTIGHAIEKTQDNNEILAYWLSNSSTLLLLLQRTLKASRAAGMTPQRRRSSSATLFGRMTQA
ncbi:Myosin-11 [Canna indica]|uniref:Myosin-11 n=1 Tax=Canna indica TaxID=4628 RepID=A0AAQ3QEA8_9LILI|nr:Myosin-11 [Canna indica]